MAVYTVVYPYVLLKAKDAAGAWINREFYAGARLDSKDIELEQATLQRHLDEGMVAEEGSPEAQVMGVPAGTPIPGEPPNVPVTEGRQGVGLDMGSRIENALEAAGVKRSARRADGRPSQQASKAEWVDYAVTQRAEGTSEEDARAEAEGLSKAELVARYRGEAAGGSV